MSMITAIYARVSTEEQNSNIQLDELREYCRRAGWTISKEYIDHLSGKSGERAAFKQMFVDATRRKFDVVLVWALDRFTREGVAKTFDYIRKLREYQVQFESYTEPQFRTTGIAGELFLAVAAWIGEQERIRIHDRTTAGLRHAQKNGTRSGKPVGRQRVIIDSVRVRELSEAGKSIREIGAELGVSYGKVHDELAAAANLADNP